MTFNRTLAADNPFRFVCPVIGTEQKIAGCFETHTRSMIGRRTPGREACNAAMASSKCPCWHIQQQMIRGADDYHGDRLGKLDERLLKRIAPIVVQERHIDEFAVPEDAANRLRSLNRAGSSAAPVDVADVAPPPEKKMRKAAAAPKTPVPDATLEAARTGNMSAAINAEMKKGSTRLGLEDFEKIMAVDGVTLDDEQRRQILEHQPAPSKRPMTLLERAQHEKQRRKMNG